MLLDTERLKSIEPAILFSLTGRVAIVTGAAGGIGRWLSAGLAAAGAAVVITDIDETGLQETQSALTSVGLNVNAVSADLTEEGASEGIVEAAINTFGSVHVLVCNAGVNRRMPIVDVDPDTWDYIIGINLRQSYFLSQAAARRMIHQGEGGSIIALSSINARYGLEHNSVYGLTKAALSQFVQVMALEWADYGIRANAIGPGFFDTPLTSSAWNDSELSRWILNRVPMERPGEPAELIGACLLLASEAGSFITGQTIHVDGGWMAGGRWFHPDRRG